MHKAVGVLTTNGTFEEVNKLMAPFHEFEATDVDDEYVINVDRTMDMRRAYLHSPMVDVIRDPKGKYSEYSHEFFCDLTPEESRIVNILRSDGVTLHDNTLFKLFGFGRVDLLIGSPGVRTTCAVHVPEGYSIEYAPLSFTCTLLEYIESECSLPTVGPDEPIDLGGIHKHGYIRLNDKEEVLEVIERTNPHSKWDYWCIGGRYHKRYHEEDMGTAWELAYAPREAYGFYFDALITPDGEWWDYDKDGASAFERMEAKKVWPSTEAFLLGKHNDVKIVTVDIHY